MLHIPGTTVLFSCDIDIDSDSENAKMAGKPKFTEAELRVIIIFDVFYYSWVIVFHYNALQYSENQVYH